MQEPTLLAQQPTLLDQQQRYLSSWKEIAQYFGRGVRTVQRWEAMLGLPVRRPHGRSRSAVMAITGELDEWLSRARLRPEVFNDRNGKRAQNEEADRLFFVILGGGGSKLRNSMAQETWRTFEAQVCQRSAISAAGAR